MRSRFLPREMLDAFAVTHWAPLILSDPPRTAPPPIDIAARMRGMGG